MKKWFVVVFFIASIVLLVSAVAFFAVPQMAIGNYDSLSACNKRIVEFCNDGYTCTSCQKQTLSYYLDFASGSTNVVFSADCKLGSDTSSGHNACPAKAVVSTPSCASQGQSCGFPNLPSCCSGLSCQNFGCYPTTTLSSCSSACASNGLRECISPDHFRTCSLSGKCLVWFDPQKCADGLACDGGKCVAPPSVSYPVCMVDGSVCRSGAQVFNGEVVGCADRVPCSNGCSNGVCTVVSPKCSVSVKCSSEYQVTSTASDCSVKVVACDDGKHCSDGRCVAIPPVPVSNSCDGITCPSYCSKDYTKYSGGSCTDGVCKYASIDTLSASCIPAVTNATGTVNNPVKDVDIVVENVVSETFLSRYGLWIAGGIFLLSLVLFIVTFTPKKRRR